jgi:hypothetical protein
VMQKSLSGLSRGYILWRFQIFAATAN